VLLCGFSLRLCDFAWTNTSISRKGAKTIAKPAKKQELLMTSEPLILAMETATRAGSVCLALGSEILASVAGDASASHSNDLIQNMQRALKASGRELSEVDFFAAAEGPGSFTGLRIGLATAKALATS